MALGTASKPGKKRRRASKTQTAILIVLCVLVFVMIALLIILLTRPAVDNDAPAAAADEWYDPAAELGNLPGRTQEEIQAELNKIVEEGMFNISIASIVVFEDGESEGAARIENIAANRYNMSVVIILDDGEETVYESKGLAPGQYIEYITLSRDLPAGEYSATALFTAYTQDTLQKVGQAAAKITLVVKQ